MATKKYNETWINTIKSPLADRKNITLPTLYIKLGQTKQVVRALDRGRDCFGCICSTFPGLSYEKQAGIFDGPQITALLKDRSLVTAVIAVEARAWNAFADGVHNFLGNKKIDNNEEMEEEEEFLSMKELGRSVSTKANYLHSHLSEFPENLCDVSEAQGKYQDIKVMEERYQGRWSCSMMADSCWSWIGDALNAAHKRSATKRKFMVS